MIRGSCCSQSRLAKAAGAEVAVQQRNEKWHAAVARSTFWSENAQNTTIAEQFSKCSSGKLVRHCGAKHLCKSKCTEGTISAVRIWKNGTPLLREAKHHIPGPLLEDQMSKNCTPLWREAHLQVKMYKVHPLWKPLARMGVSRVKLGWGCLTPPKKN